MKSRSSILAVVLFAAYLCGCSTTLAPGGVYNGDTYLYATDNTISILKSSLDTFVTWEYQNRPAILAQWPGVTVAADKVRLEAPTWFAGINIARTAYLTVRNGTAVTNPDTIAVAKSTLTARVNDAAAQVTSAQALVNTTTIASKPVLKISP